jgi:predicted DNA-binding protein
MKTTIDMPDELWDRAKAYATKERRSLASLVAEGLESILPKRVTITYTAEKKARSSKKVGER